MFFAGDRSAISVGQSILVFLSLQGQLQCDMFSEDPSLGSVFTRKDCAMFALNVFK